MDRKKEQLRETEQNHGALLITATEYCHCLGRRKHVVSLLPYPQPYLFQGLLIRAPSSSPDELQRLFCAKQTYTGRLNLKLNVLRRPQRVENFLPESGPDDLVLDEERSRDALRPPHPRRGATAPA